MAAESNGRVAEPGQKGMNGSVKAPLSKPVKTAKGFSLFSTISRLLTWYSIITILIRCPATVDLLTDTSPKICKPYFQLRSVVAPHLEPYYHTYAAPYIDAAQPYYDTLDKRIITPAKALGVKYGAPRVAQAQAFGQAQWEKTLQPQVLKYQGLAKEKYDQTLGPHVEKALASASPYYDLAKTNALQTYYEFILPTYTAVEPYAIHGYGVANDFALNTAIPYSQWAWTTVTVFLDRTVWPKLRILYGENVEPQLVRIGERLGRYRDGKKLKAVIDEVDSSSSASAATESFSSISSSIASAYSTAPPVPGVTHESQVSEQEAKEKEAIANAQKVVAKDLKTWQEKFAKAADEGSEELEERITEITDRLVQNQAQGVGKALIIQLEETIKSSLQTLKKSIVSIVKDAKDAETSEDDLNAAVRKAGVAIKEKAQAVRTWRQSYDREANSLVTQSAETTFEILDNIRDLGLQEIGMRWAWTDGVTHKDWKKYHQLKNKFDEWRTDVEKVLTEHPGLEKAKAASEEVESQAMTIAEDAAKELARLKETGRWKISAGDSTDDFSTKIMPAAAAAAAKKVVKKVSELSEAVAPSSQGTVEFVISLASSSIADAASSASSIAASQVEDAQSVVSSASANIVGTPQGSVESVISVGSASASSLADKASSSIIGTSQGTVESAASAAKASASSIVDQASSSIIGTPQGSVGSAVSVASESASSLSATASSSMVGKEPGAVEKASSNVKSAASVVSESASSVSDAASSSISSGSSELSKGVSQASASLSSATSSVASSLSKSSTSASSSISSAASSASSTASKKVWGGAMAEEVPTRQIIFEDFVADSDDTSFSEKLQSMASEAGDRYSDMTKAVSEALLGPTSTQTVHVTKLAAEKYSNALSAASVALYGTEQGTGESVTSMVASRYSDAVAAASSILYGTPMPITDSIAAKATEAYSAALSRASDNYAHARSVISAQVSGEPKPVHQEILGSLETAYSDSVAAASSRLQDALSAASTVMYGTPTPAYQSVWESLSSVAQSRMSEGLSAASAQYDDAKGYVASLNAPAPTKQKLLGQIQEQYYAGVGMAHARYSDFINAASSAVMPTKTPFHESLYSKASANIVGTPTPALDAALSTAKSHYSNAVAGASSQLDQVIASIAKIGGEHKEAVPISSLVSLASSRYSVAMAEASSSYSSINSVISERLAGAASAASTAVIGSETPWTESVASAASENWEELITKASSQIYGAPTPYFITQRLFSEAREYAAQATDGVASQYSAVQSLISELVSGKEPDFTESVYSRFSSAYYTGAGQFASSASSYASEVYVSASSVVSSVFTPPPTIEAILDSASSRVNEAVEAASIQFYGTEKGSYEQATSAAASAYSSAQSIASEQIYGTTTRYAEAAQSSIADAASSAQKAISEAIWGTPTGTYESATSAAAERYASATAAISNAIYGQEQGALESAQSRLSAAVESARVKLAEFAASAGEGASEYVKQASEGVEDFASSVSSIVSSATASSKDEL